MCVVDLDRRVCGCGGECPRWMTAWGNLVRSSCTRSATNIPKRVGLRRLPSGSLLRMSTVWCAEMPGWRTRSLILSNLARRWCHMLPLRVEFLLKTDSGYIFKAPNYITFFFLTAFPAIHFPLLYLAFCSLDPPDSR